MTGSNRRPPACKAGALPAELILQNGDPYGTRTRVTTVKGWCLNRLTKGPNLLNFIYMYRLVSTESKGFEPLRQLPAYTISNRAPSTTRTALQNCSAGKIRTYDYSVNSRGLYH